jgi:hypothetical protein
MLNSLNSIEVFTIIHIGEALKVNKIPQLNNFSKKFR